MESKTEEANQINKKPFKLSLKPLTNNENEKKEKINKLTDVLISYNIIPFLKIREAKEVGKTNKRLYNAFVRYYLRKRDSLINKYNIKLENEDDYVPNEIYEQKDDKGHFIRLSYYNLEHYLLFSYFKWTWQDNDQYWDRIKPKNSILGKDICHLKTVCWVDVNASMTHVYSGKYKLYLNHCVCNLKENMLKMTILIDGVPLKEFIYPSREQVNVCREVHSDKKEEDKKEEDKKDEDIKEEDKIEEKNTNPNLDVIRPVRRGLIRRPFLRIRGNPQVNVTYNKQNSLNKVYIMDVDIIYDDKIDSTTGHELTVKFDHTEGSWKNNWLIDAVILESLDNKV